MVDEYYIYSSYYIYGPYYILGDTAHAILRRLPGSFWDTERLVLFSALVSKLNMYFNQHNKC